MKFSNKEMSKISPKNFRKLVREKKWIDTTEPAVTFKGMVCKNYAVMNLVILHERYSHDFLLFCKENKDSCQVIEVTDVGNPNPKFLAPDSDLRTDIPLYRVFKDGKLIDEPTDVVKYWNDKMVCFLIGNSVNFRWALWDANIFWRRYGAYKTNLKCKPVGIFHGTKVVTVRAFKNSFDAIRAIQISSRYSVGHGAPIHIGDPKEIGIKNIGKPDSFNPFRPIAKPPNETEIVMSWGCGVTPQTVALEAKIPFMITHSPAHLFVTDKLAEELSDF